MQVESKKSFSHGFVLTEAELRRLVETIAEQFAKLPDHPASSATYQLKYRNGSIADTHSLDEIFTQENIGSSQIIRLSISSATMLGPDTVTVFVEFINADVDEEPGYTSIRFTVRGNSRDWVFVTSTLLEERITRIKRFSFNQLGSKGSAASRLGALAAPTFAAVLLIIIMMPAIYFSTDYARRSMAAELIEARKKGAIADAVDALVFLEQRRAEREGLYPQFLLYPLGVLIGAILVLLLVVTFLMRYYLEYNFCWGDYTEFFNKRESVRKYVVVVIITGLVVSFVGGLLANRLRWW